MYADDGECVACGAPLPTRRRRDMRACSATCRKALTRTASVPEIRNCTHCGSVLTGQQRKYCGRACSRLAERGPKLDRSTPVSCKRCGIAITPKADGPLPTFCSGACRAAAGYQAARKDGRYDAWREARRAAYTPIVHQLVCQRADCTAPFTSKSPSAMWCGSRCAMRAYNARREEDGRLAKYRAERRQREAEQSDPSEVFRAADVYERDDWQCWLCDEPIDRDAAWPAPLSPSVDHVVPLSKGGPHTLANVKAAHLRCNLIKSDRMITAA